MVVFDLGSDRLLKLITFAPLKFFVKENSLLYLSLLNLFFGKQSFSRQVKRCQKPFHS